MNIYQTLKENSNQLISHTEENRVAALELIAQELLIQKAKIISENQKDFVKAKADGISSSNLDRLLLDERRIEAMSQACLEIAQQKQVLGMSSDTLIRPNGLKVKIQRIPLGMLAMVFESRPNVVIDAMALAIKSGNGLILKGGKEAQHSNRCLFDLAASAFESIFKLKVFHYLESREEFHNLLKQNQLIDLVIARGGSELVKYVKTEATMPVMSHDKGLCHIYVHADADSSQVEKIVLNAKASRPGVCNALESLIIHKDYQHTKLLIEKLLANGIEVRGCTQSIKINNEVKAATAVDYHTEFLALTMSLKIVNSFDEAITHIQAHSSHHTEAILAKDESIINKFINSLDSSCIVVNSSTRFNDGGELGLGAELGISTSKFHAYGPVGAEQMTTKRFVVIGTGQIR